MCVFCTFLPFFCRIVPFFNPFIYKVLFHHGFSKEVVPVMQKFQTRRSIFPVLLFLILSCCFFHGQRVSAFTSPSADNTEFSDTLPWFLTDIGAEMIFFLKDGTNDFHLHFPQKRKYNLMRCSIHIIF